MIIKQMSLFPTRPKGQLLKWVGNKFRFANEITNYFPQSYHTYFEPFVGTGAILATLNPRTAIAGDTLKPLIDLWHLVQENPEEIKEYYADVMEKYCSNRNDVYNEIKQRYNENPNALDLLFISRTCYGGVIRFTKEGKISTPIGPHKPMPSLTFNKRLQEWKDRVKNVEFVFADYKELMQQVKKGDLVYCDPPYKDSQTILYGAQTFVLKELFEEIAKVKNRGAKVALSIDGVKKSGLKEILLETPDDLFEREVFIECGNSMLKRFQKEGEKMDGEIVKERLLLTW